MSIATAVATTYWRFWHRATLLEPFIKERDQHYGDRRRDDEGLIVRLERLLAGEDVEYPEGTELVDVDDKHMPALIEATKYAVLRTATYATMIHEMVLVYTVALFDTFLISAIAAVIAERPELLKSSKQITYEKVLEIGDRRALIEYLLEREIVELGYKSIAEQAAYLEQKLNIQLVGADVDLTELIEIRARRNLFVHNDGVVNSVYLGIVGRASAAAGERIQLRTEYVMRAGEVLHRVAVHLFREILRKFPPTDDEIDRLLPAMLLPLARVVRSAT